MSGSEYASRDDWVDGPSDLKEDDVEDVPVPGKKVRVRGLAAGFSNQASSEAVELTSGRRGEQKSKINTARLEELQFLHGVIKPQFSEEDVRVISQKYGPAFKKAIARIDELSGVDKEAMEKAEARFPGSGADANGADVGAATPAGGS